MDSVNHLIDLALPGICVRPPSPFELPALLLNDSECFRATFSRALGIAMVLFASIIKLPQIATIVNQKSVAGLSATTFLIETFGYTYNLAAHYRQNYPVTTYGEFFVLLAQNYYILYLIYAYTKRPQLGVGIVISFIAGLALLCSPIFPVEIIQLMTLGNVAVVVAGRTPQAYTNYVNGSTGALSPFTCWGIFLGACARIFTTLQDVDSITILLGYLSSALLNGIIAFQVIYYRLYPSKGPADKVKKAA